MIVADTSAWVEFLRATDNKVATKLRELIERDEDVALTEVILMELLAGARSATPVRDLRSRLLGFKVLPLEGLADFEQARVIYRACRDAGETLRRLRNSL